MSPGLPFSLSLPLDGAPKTVLVFSPHPDDDVISMGGTIIRMVEQHHKVHIAYMTSGNIALFDHDAWRYTDFVCELNGIFGIGKEQSEVVKRRVHDFLRSKTPGQPDSPDLLNIKKLIRETEARAGALACGKTSGGGGQACRHRLGYVQHRSPCSLPGDDQ